MTRRRLLWITPTAIWLLFTFWYTDFGGPLTDEEIAVGIEKVRSQGYGAQQISDLEAFLKSDTGRQFLMVNNIDMNDNLPQMPGFGPDATASDYVNHYMEHMFPQLLKRACHPIFMGAGLSYDNDVAGVGEAAHLAGIPRRCFDIAVGVVFLKLLRMPIRKAATSTRLPPWSKQLPMR